MSDTRRIAQSPRLDLAIRARGDMMPRLKLRPYVMIERKRSVSVTARRSNLDSANSASFSRQVVYTNNGGKIERRSARLAGGGGGGAAGAGGSGGGGRGGGGWPF